jgi:tRNA G18 (ribose-2'-O)-methylase SpoU
MTARPAGVTERLREQERDRPGAEGAKVDRLPLIVIVDSVRSLWNVGSIFRTADACGVERLLLTGITGHPPRPEIAKTALGAEETVAWNYHADSHEALARVKDEGYTPVAIENAPGATSLFEMTWPSRVCLVLGNEVAGVSGGVLDDCPLRVRIPMLGLKESLNVAVAFGIVACSAAGALLQSKGTSTRGDDDHH